MNTTSHINKHKKISFRPANILKSLTALILFSQKGISINIPSHFIMPSKMCQKCSVKKDALKNFAKFIGIPVSEAFSIARRLKLY